MMSDSEFLQWVHDRLHYKYGENINVDFMHRLKRIVLDGVKPNNKCDCDKR